MAFFIAIIFHGLLTKVFVNTFKREIFLKHLFEKHMP